MKIAIDVGIGKRGAEILRAAGHEVLEAEHGEMDSIWLERTKAEGARLYVSADADVSIYAYDRNVPYLQARQGESGADLARRVLTFLADTKGLTLDTCQVLQAGIERLIRDSQEPAWITLPAIIKTVNDQLIGFTPEQRVALFNQLVQGYCRACGWERDGICHCENDE
jgi:hypothetical protein